MRFAPKYTRKDRVDATGTAFGTLLVFLGIGLVSVALFAFGGSDVPPSGDGIWSSVRWIALPVALVAFYLSIQSLFELLIAATIGPERFLAFFVIVVGICSVGAWALTLL